jgi:hypothetical protein
LSDSLPLEPEPERTLGFKHRLGGDLPPCWRDQFDRSDSIEVRLCRKVDTGEHHDEQVGETAADRQQCSAEPRQAASAGRANGRHQPVHLVAQSHIADARFKISPGVRQRFPKRLHLLTHLLPEKRYQGGDRAKDEQNG